MFPLSLVFFWVLIHNNRNRRRKNDVAWRSEMKLYAARCVWKGRTTNGNRKKKSIFLGSGLKMLLKGFNVILNCCNFQFLNNFVFFEIPWKFFLRVFLAFSAVDSKKYYSQLMGIWGLFNRIVVHFKRDFIKFMAANLKTLSQK